MLLGPGFLNKYVHLFAVSWMTLELQVLQWSTDCLMNDVDTNPTRLLSFSRYEFEYAVPKILFP